MLLFVIYDVLWYYSVLPCSIIVGRQHVAVFATIFELYWFENEKLVYRYLSSESVKSWRVEIESGA